MSNKKEYTLKQVSEILGVHRDTIVYWEENNLIPKPRRNPKNRYRVYNEQEILEIARLRGIDYVNFERVQ
jgi:DNA-binding transcriptional MerR regulator